MIHRWIFLFALSFVILSTTGCTAIRSKIMFYPTHRAGYGELSEWRIGDRAIGCAHESKAPRTVWLFLPGNGGQAANRTYAMHVFSPSDSVYILEYPGFGTRPGTPSVLSVDSAAAEAYSELRTRFPSTPVCVVAESIGSGPACLLTLTQPPPEKLVLIVPFDRFNEVASDHVPFLPMCLVIGKTWDNIAALQHYTGPVEIFGARDDSIIPVRHAMQLAKSVPQAQFHLIAGNHNDWSRQMEVQIRYK